MVCIEKRPHKMRGRSLAPNFIYLTCLLDRGHIIYENHLWKCKVSINGFRFLCNKKFLQNFLLHKKRSTMDAHSREWKNVAKATRARHIECPKRHSYII